MSLTPLINILREFLKKFEMVLLGYSGARGTLIYEKNLKSKISCQTPFNKADWLYSVTTFFLDSLPASFPQASISFSPPKILLPVSLTPAINLCHGFSVIAGVVDTREQFITGDNDTSNNFVAGDNDTSDNFVAGDNDTGEQLSPVTTTPAINLLPVTRTWTPCR